MPQNTQHTQAAPNNATPSPNLPRIVTCDPAVDQKNAVVTLWHNNQVEYVTPCTDVSAPEIAEYLRGYLHEDPTLTVVVSATGLCLPIIDELQAGSDTGPALVSDPVYINRVLVAQTLRVPPARPADSGSAGKTATAGSAYASLRAGLLATLTGRLPVSCACEDCLARRRRRQRGWLWIFAGTTLLQLSTIASVALSFIRH